MFLATEQRRDKNVKRCMHTFHSSIILVERFYLRIVVQSCKLLSSVENEVPLNYLYIASNLKVLKRWNLFAVVRKLFKQTEFFIQFSLRYRYLMQDIFFVV